MSRASEGWIQKRTRTSPKTGKVTTKYIGRIKPPGMDEIYSTPFDRHGKPNEPGTAAHWLAEQRDLLRRGALIDPRARKWTVTEWVEHWYPDRGRARTTDSNYRNMIKNDLAPSAFGAMPLSSVTDTDVSEWLRDMASDRSWSDEGKLAVSTVNVRLAMLSAALNGAVSRNVLSSNPASAVRKLKALPTVTAIDPNQIPTRDQIWLWYDLAAQLVPHLQEPIIVAAGTGLRPGELFGLDAEVITRKRGRVTEIYVGRQLNLAETGTQFGPPKTDNSYRRIPVGRQVSDAIDRHLDRFPLDPDQEHGTVVFRARTGRPWSKTLFNDLWTEVRDAAGTPGAIWYRFRHFYISGLIEGGASPKLVMERAGHGSPTYTMARYARLWPNADSVTAQLSDAALERDLNGTRDIA